MCRECLNLDRGWIAEGSKSMEAENSALSRDMLWREDGDQPTGDQMLKRRWA